MLEILQKENKILHKIAKEIKSSDFSSAKIKKIIKEMAETLDAQEDGVALAAPQIGESFRLFIVSTKVFNIEKNKKNISKKHLIFINPEIIKESQKKEWVEEGCLSVRGVFGKVRRATRCTVRAYDEKGVEFTRGGGGLLAQIFQHEIDHLNGILFIDKAKNLEMINKI